MLWWFTLPPTGMLSEQLELELSESLELLVDESFSSTRGGAFSLIRHFGPLVFLLFINNGHPAITFTTNIFYTMNVILLIYSINTLIKIKGSLIY